MHAHFTLSCIGKLLDGPTLPELLCLKIPQRVGSHYFEFGVLLLNDLTGSHVMRWRQECQGDPVRIVLGILQEWLEWRNGKPVTWESLVMVLRDIGLPKLADQIATKTQLSIKPVPGEMCPCHFHVKFDQVVTL